MCVPASWSRSRGSRGAPDVGGDRGLESRVDLQEVRDDERDGRAVPALGDERPSVQRVVDPGRAADAGAEPVHRMTQGRRDVHDGRADLHAGTRSSTTVWPVRLDS